MWSISIGSPQNIPKVLETKETPGGAKSRLVVHGPVIYNLVILVFTTTSLHLLNTCIHHRFIIGGYIITSYGDKQSSMNSSQPRWTSEYMKYTAGVIKGGGKSDSPSMDVEWHPVRGWWTFCSLKSQFAQHFIFILIITINF